MKQLSLFACLLMISLFVTACSDDDDDNQRSQPSTNNPTTASSSDLCLSSDCGAAVPLVTIPDAENILFTPEGRLFVSGGLSVYEISKLPDGSFIATPIADAECSFTGLVQRDNHLYAVCMDGRLFAGQISSTPLLTQIYTFTDNPCLPNGAALGPDGKLYVVDGPAGPCAPNPRIVRLTLDPNDPMQIIDQQTWLQGGPLGLLFANMDQTLQFPNGLVSLGNYFYSTDGGTVFSVELLPDGSAAAPVGLYFTPTILDDLSVAEDGESLLVSDFGLGTIFQLSLDGELLQATNPSTFAAASAVQQSHPPMFGPDDILVTEKGVLQDTQSPVGNQLTLFRKN